MFARSVNVSKYNFQKLKVFKHISKNGSRFIATETDKDQPVKMENPYTVKASRCLLCGVKVDYKNVQLLSQFVSPYTGLQTPKKLSGLCDRKFEEVKQNIVTSRRSGFMPTQYKETIFIDDPDIVHTSYSPKKTEKPSS